MKKTLVVIAALAVVLSCKKEATPEIVEPFCRVNSGVTEVNDIKVTGKLHEWLTDTSSGYVVRTGYNLDNTTTQDDGYICIYFNQKPTTGASYALMDNLSYLDKLNSSSKVAYLFLREKGEFYYSSYGKVVVAPTADGKMEICVNPVQIESKYDSTVVICQHFVINPF